MPKSESHPGSSPSYVVVARRYRPQGFGELIGQEHVSQALSNAIATHRVGHAYLFTGAREPARLPRPDLRESPQLREWPTAEPCNTCDSCQSISTGNDVDVLEIDGPAIAASTTFATCGRTPTCGPVARVSRSTLSTKVHMLSRRGIQRLAEDARGTPSTSSSFFAPPRRRRFRLRSFRGASGSILPASRRDRSSTACGRLSRPKGPGRGRSLGSPRPSGRRLDA